MWLTWLARTLLHCCNSMAMLKKGRKLTSIYRVIQEENSAFWEVIMSIMCPIRNGYRDTAAWICKYKSIANNKRGRVIIECSFCFSFCLMFRLKNLLHTYDKLWAAIAQSVYRLATGWTVRGSNPSWGGEIFHTRPDQPWGPPRLLYNGYRVFSGGKAAGAWRNHPPLI